MEDFVSQHAVLWNSESQNATLVLLPEAVKPTVPSMQQHRPQFLVPRRALLRRDLFHSRGRVLASRTPLRRMSAGEFWPAGPVQTESRRNGLSPGPGFAQAPFEAALMGSSWGLPPFEQVRRAGSPYPAPLTPRATMATVASWPCAGGSRDILWRVSAAFAVVCAGPRLGACEWGGGGTGPGVAWGARGARTC